MSAFGIHFGTMTVTRVQENDTTVSYKLFAKGYLKFLGMERNDETHNEVIYKNEKLFSSCYKQIESGELKKWTTIKFDGKHYQVDSYKGKRSFIEAPAFSVLSMYFMLPKNLSRIFDESECNYCNIKYQDENTIEIKNSEGNRSVYHYTKGVLTEMEFHISIATVHMKKIS